VGLQARDRLIESQLSLVRSVAKRYAVDDEPLDDLVQVGSIGLIKAVDRFDAARGRALEPYAAAAIAGEIRHHLRDRSAPVRVPRRLQAEGLRVRPVTLEAAGDLASGPDPTAAADDRIALERALRVLAPREREILRLHYFGDLSQAQIGARLGLSQVHVSRLENGALAQLRAELTAGGHVAAAS
jgi:RNA polymerase sigma-B factor